MIAAEKKINETKQNKTIRTHGLEYEPRGIYYVIFGFMHKIICFKNETKQTGEKERECVALRINHPRHGLAFNSLEGKEKTFISNLLEC